MSDPLRAEIHKTVVRYCGAQPHRDAVLQVLERPGFALHPDARCRAGTLCIEAYRAIRGNPDGPGWAAAAAVELYIEAAFIFDDIADQELDQGDDWSASERLALAITLMNCGTAAACEVVLRAGRGNSAVRALRQLSRDALDACAGQYMDAHLERRETVTTDEAIKMTSLKAGSCGRVAAAFGAGIACDDPETVRLFADFGSSLFTYMQLVDDLRDARPSQGPSRDMAQSKKTVPLVYFYNTLDASGDAGTGDIIRTRTDEGSVTEVRREYDESGAGVFGAIVAETYLGQAKSILAEIGARIGEVKNLEGLVSSLESSPHGVVAPS